MRVLVKSLYTVFAKAMGQWLGRRVGLPFCIGGLCGWFSKRWAWFFVCSSVR